MTVFAPYGASTTIEVTQSSQTVPLPAMPSGTAAFSLVSRQSAIQALYIKLGDNTVTVTEDTGMRVFPGSPDQPSIFAVPANESHIAILCIGTPGKVMLTAGILLSGNTTTIVVDNSVTNAKLRDSGALSVIGRSANSIGDPADIAAIATSDAVLRESGSTLGFGTIATAGIANNAVTYAKMQDVSATARFIGRITAGAGDPEELTGTNAKTIIGSATTAVDGVVELATTTEQLTGTDAALAATPDSVAALWERGANIASAATISIGEGGYFHVTGTTTITDIDFATPKDGRSAILVFDGILTLTHNATTLVLPSGGNITTAAGDRCCVVQDNSDNVYVVWYQRADGTSLAGGTGGTIRELLTANRTYYVRTDGSDTNNGLTNLSGGAFATLQKAYNVIAGTLDLAGYTVTIQQGTAGTLTGALLLSQSWSGGGAVTIDLGGGTLSVTANHAIRSIAPLAGTLTIQNGTISTTTSGSCIRTDAAGLIVIGSSVTFGACAGVHFDANTGRAFIRVDANYTISGGATFYHLFASHGGYIECNGKTVTLTGTPAFTAFAAAVDRSGLGVPGNTYTGAATGSRYSVTENSVIATGGGGANYFPGNAAGSTATGGQYT